MFTSLFGIVYIGVDVRTASTGEFKWTGHLSPVISCKVGFQEEFYGRSLIVADRELVESGADEILKGADQEDIAFLVVGDPFGATTHTDLVIRAREQNISFQVVHNASIMNAIGCCGLQLYSFGETISIPYWD